ncbi:MAG TPA: iron-sulfur cluster carrier protein ApbC [Pseudomonadales bacterium]|nr:iron-sulfur cluster carrier protein ApbC [Pseudomonadales bacterium]
MIFTKKGAVESVLAAFVVPGLDRSLRDLKATWQVQIDHGSCQITLKIGFPCRGLEAQLKEALIQAVKQINGIHEVVVEVVIKISAHNVASQKPLLRGIKNIIAVASGKGGVGKSTTSVNMALALAVEGASVGILDADIYGPSIPMMLGIDDSIRPEIVEEKFLKPIVRHGIHSLSMGNLITENTPVVWRAPKVTGALLQLFQQSYWDEIDYLIVDLPPGTGDIQLTLAQSIPVTAAVIVTTPQDIALLDARKAIEMFAKVNIPVLGIVENMSVYTCSACGHSEHIFGAEGGKAIAAQYHLPLLGALPLALSIREQADGGRPSVAAEPESSISHSYRDIARRVAASIAVMERNRAIPVVS